MSPISYVVLKDQVDVVDKVIECLQFARSEAQNLLDADFRAEVTGSLDDVYRALYDGKVRFLSEMECPCAVG